MASDAVWGAQRTMPTRLLAWFHPLGCHRPRICDEVCFRGLMIRLVTGASWVDVEAIMDFEVSDTTLRARRDEWIAAGVFDELCKEASAAFDRIVGLDLEEVALDGSLHKAPCGGEGTGPNPTDRQRIGVSAMVRSRGRALTACRSAGPSVACQPQVDAGPPELRHPPSSWPSRSAGAPAKTCGTGWRPGPSRGYPRLSADLVLRKSRLAALGIDDCY